MIDRVKLSIPEMQRAVEVGKLRHKSNVENGKKDAYGFKGDGEAINIDGCYGEIAVSILTGKVWHAFCHSFERIKADIGDRHQARSTRLKYGNLILHPKDNDDHVFVLCRIHGLPIVEFVGWIFAHEGKRSEYWRDKGSFAERPCFLYPARSLRLLTTLPKD